MAKKMVDIDVLETSGVDHPAHMHEGFLVMKSADPDKARAILAALRKDKNMTGTSKTAPAAKSSEVAADAATIEAAVAKAIDSKLQPILDGLAQTWQDLRQFAESNDDATPTTDAPAAASMDDADPMAAAAGEDVLKALPAEVRKALEEQRAELRKTRDELKKERDERLDQEAIAKAAKEFPNLNLAPDVVKAIRRVGEVDPDLHKNLATLLVASNAQLDGAPLTKALGSDGATSAPASDKVEEMAKALVAEGTHDTIQKARVAVYEAHPELVAQIKEEVR